MGKRRKKRDAIGSLGGVGLGLGKLGVSVPVGAAVASRGIAAAPVAQRAALAPMMGGFGQVAQAAPIATTAMVGKGIIGSLKDLNKKTKKKRKGRF